VTAIAMTKKQSGAQRRAWKRLNNDPASPFHGILRSGKRGRPKGETKSIEERRGWVELDFLFLVRVGAVDIGERRWTDLRIANELLLDDSTRWEKHKLGKCKYRRVHKETLRRLIATLRNKFYEPKTPLRVR
jgi:hypothetical protein